jgi:glycosyltransferase 2 family protein
LIPPGPAVTPERPESLPRVDAGLGAPIVEQADDPKTVLTSRWRLVVRGILGVSLGLAVAAAAARLTGVKMARVAESMAGVPLWAVAACVGSSFVVLAWQSLRWYAVMRPVLGLGYGQAYRGQLIGYMFNVLPGRVGDLLRVQYLGRRTGKSRATILGTEVVDRWLDFWGWMPTMLVLAALGGVPSWVWKAVALFGALLVSWAVTMVVLTRRGYVPRPGSRLSSLYGAFRDGVQAFTTRRTLAIAFTLAPLPWIWEAAVIRLVTPAFGIDVDYVRAFCVLVGFNLAMVVPSPGAIGTEEAGGVNAFAFFGADPSRALAFMIVYHLAQMIPGIMAGVTLLAAEGEVLFGKKSASSP